MNYIRLPAFAVCAALLAAACSQNRPEGDTAMGEPSRDTTSDTSMVSQQDTTQQQQDTTGNVEQQQQQQDQQQPPMQQGDSAQKIQMGQRVFEGTEGGANCYSCHGRDAKGTTLGPDLTDQQWIHGDGSLEFIKTIVQNGVPTPKEFQTAMPAFQTTLNDEQIDAVASYVRSLGRSEGIGSH